MSAEKTLDEYTTWYIRSLSQLVSFIVKRCFFSLIKSKVYYEKIERLRIYCPFSVLMNYSGNRFIVLIITYISNKYLLF